MRMSPWPTCPECGAKRTARCPYCRTEGTNFPPVDLETLAAPELTPDLLLYRADRYCHGEDPEVIMDPNPLSPEWIHTTLGQAKLRLEEFDRTEPEETRAGSEGYETESHATESHAAEDYAAEDYATEGGEPAAGKSCCCGAGRTHEHGAGETCSHGAGECCHGAREACGHGSGESCCHNGEKSACHCHETSGGMENDAADGAGNGTVGGAACGFTGGAACGSGNETPNGTENGTADGTACGTGNGSCSCQAKWRPSVRLIDPLEPLPEVDAEAGEYPLAVKCPVCDEILLPKFLDTCQECGHVFEDGIAKNPRKKEKLPDGDPLRMALVFGVLVALLGLMLLAMWK